MAVIATGFFDGVHLGHRQVLGTLVSCARESGQEAVVLTFSQHPRTVLQQDAMNLRLLNSLDEKRALLESAGIDRVEVLDFTKAFAGMDTESYLQFLRNRFDATSVVLGYDNRIGSDQLMPQDITAIAERCGVRTVIAPPVDSPDGGHISSTRIRRTLEAGDVQAAEAMLGYRYSLRGAVVAGNRIGRTLGYPTANMQLYEPLKMIPAAGAYLVDVDVVGRKLSGMCNVGMRPTVGGSSLTIETNIFDFSEDIYGLPLEIKFARRLRAERKFNSLDDLKAQLRADEAACRGL